MKKAQHVDNPGERETDEFRQIRAQLRLSDQWEVLSKEVETLLHEYSDDNPDAPDGASDDPESWKTEVLGRVTISVRDRKSVV